MLLLKLTDHMFPVKLVIGSQVSSFWRGKSPHPMRNSGPFFVIRLSFTSRTKNSVCLLFDFSKGFLQARAWPETSQSQISHPHPGSSWPFFLLQPLPHSLPQAESLLNIRQITTSSSYNTEWSFQTKKIS
jgi:hypothetical protein